MKRALSDMPICLVTLQYTMLGIEVAISTGLWKIDTVAKKWKLYLLICLDCWFVLIVDHLIVVVVVPAWFTSHNSKKTLILLVTLLSDKMNCMIQKPTGNCQWKCYWSMLNHCLVLVMPAKCDGYNYLCTIVVPIVWRDCYNYFSIIN